MTGRAVEQIGSQYIRHCNANGRPYDNVELRYSTSLSNCHSDIKGERPLSKLGLCCEKGFQFALVFGRHRLHPGVPSPCLQQSALPIQNILPQPLHTGGPSFGCQVEEAMELLSASYPASPRWVRASRPPACFLDSSTGALAGRNVAATPLPAGIFTIRGVAVLATCGVFIAATGRSEER